MHDQNSPGNDRLLRIINYSVPIGRWLMGIPVRLHWSLALTPFIAYSVLPASGLPFWKMALSAVLLPALVYAFVYLHECGHAFANRLYDLPVHRIYLFALGGICMGGWLRSRREELVVTIFGPLVNLVFVVLSLSALFLWQWGAGQPLSLVLFTCRFAGFQAVSWELLTFIFIVNFAMSVFNLAVPMFPMDAGRLLRATLARWYTPLKATEIVVRVGVALGVIVIAGGLVLMVSNFSYAPDGLQLIMIALLMMYFGRKELEHARMQPVYNVHNLPYMQISPEGDIEDEAEGEEWKKAAKPPPKPGFIARWRESRRLKKQQREAEAETARRLRVDQLLEKISREGIGALTNEERTFLSSASKAFRNRVSSELNTR